MGLFSDGKEKDPAKLEALGAEVARLEAMPLPEVAEQVMVRAWGAGGRADAYENERGELVLDLDDLQAIFAGEVVAGSDEADAIGGVVEEAVQLLEHAKLVVLRVGGSDFVRAEFRPTRAGLEAINAGDVRARLGG